ncbi:hypothetical protein [Methylomonas sp. YC3]
MTHCLIPLSSSLKTHQGQACSLIFMPLKLFKEKITMQKSIFRCLTTSSLILASSQSLAAIAPPTLPTVIGFSALGTATAGKPDLPANPATGGCPGPSAIYGTCYQEDGFLVGVVYEGGGEHIHSATVSGNKRAQYHADSTGIYIRAKDSSAFSLDSMDFYAPINAGNPIYGDNPTYSAYNDGNGGQYLVPEPVSSSPDDTALLGDNEYWEILGFNSAANPGLAGATSDGTNYSTRVAYQTVANGFQGNLLLNEDFRNINAFWIHYHGFPRVPDIGISFGMQLDNVNISTAVPIPSAAWLLITGLAGMWTAAGKLRDRGEA